MARLIYTAIASLDGYVSDAAGSFDWAVPDEEVHSFINQLEGTVGTHLFGRKMYEVMVAWETLEVSEAPEPVVAFPDIWKNTEKIVYSRTLEGVDTARTRLERQFNPGAVEQLKASEDRDLSIGGPELAAHAFRAGVVNECHLFLVPVLVGGGRKALPETVRVDLALLDERSFRSSGVVYVRYAVRN